MTQEQDSNPQDTPIVDVSNFCPKGDVLVVAEQILGELQPVTLELLGAGRLLADKMGAETEGSNYRLQVGRDRAEANRARRR